MDYGWIGRPARSIVLSCLLAYPGAALEGLIMVTRHGDREPLWKHHSSLTEDRQQQKNFGGPGLTAEGASRLEIIGQGLRKRYFQPTCNGDLCFSDWDGEHEPSYVHVESSGLLRSLQSAYALHKGFFPAENRSIALPIPVYSRVDAEDWVVRAYTKCPKITAKLGEWMTSEEFRQKETQSEGLRRQIRQALLSDSNPRNYTGSGSQQADSVPLRDWWNAYDALNVADQSGQPLVDQTVLREVANLVAWIEARKFGVKVAGNLCGGPLLGDIAQRMSTMVTREGPRLIHYSAHYATMLCLLTSLGFAVDGAYSSAWLSSSPFALGSVLAFEVSLGSEGQTLVKLWYWSGDDWWPVHLPCDNTSGTCSVQQFVGVATVAAPSSVESWCTACENSEMPACRIAAKLPGVPPADDCRITTMVLLGILFCCTGCLLLTAFVLIRRLKGSGDEEKLSLEAARYIPNDDLIGVPEKSL